jgi:cellulose synthase/poly-beta-1,6-N-acetylglucosamine synthase-like glycosyltransferase
METVTFLFYFIALVYFLNILWLAYGFTKVKYFETEEIVPKTKFSIIVPFRNEAENLPKLLHSITLLNYPSDLFEVVLVDDDSEEKFRIPDSGFRTTLIQNVRTSHSPKKDAINTAIKQASGDWIATTDADCLVQEDWLKTMDNYIQKNNPKMIASGVFYKTQETFLDAFQQLDLLSLQGTTIGSFGNQQAFMCNGANFCYQKSFFDELGGFSGNDTIASGDDVFLLQKAITKDPAKVHFLKSASAIVQTQTEKMWAGLFYQRVRWASKAGNYTGFYSRQLAISVMLMNLAWMLVAGCWLMRQLNNDFFVVFAGLKFFVDLILLRQTSAFFKTRLHYVLPCSLIYPFFCVSVAMYSLFGHYTWKGRTFRK